MSAPRLLTREERRMIADGLFSLAEVHEEDVEIHNRSDLSSSADNAVQSQKDADAAKALADAFYPPSTAGMIGVRVVIGAEVTDPASELLAIARHAARMDIAPDVLQKRARAAVDKAEGRS